MVLLIHKRKSSLPTNTVTAGGLVIGCVFPCSKIAAGTGGQRRRFYTAEAYYPGHANIRTAPSLGTRYPTRAAAANALRDFHANYPLATLNVKAQQFDGEVRRINMLEYHDNPATLLRRMRGRALAWAVTRWRTEQGIAGGRRFPVRAAA